MRRSTLALYVVSGIVASVSFAVLMAPVGPLTVAVTVVALAFALAAVAACLTDGMPALAHTMPAVYAERCIPTAQPGWQSEVDASRVAAVDPDYLIDAYSPDLAPQQTAAPLPTVVAGDAIDDLIGAPVVQAVVVPAVAIPAKPKRVRKPVVKVAVAEPTVKATRKPRAATTSRVAAKASKPTTTPRKRASKKAPE